MFDLIVAGAGAAGAWSAFQAQARGLKVLVLDIGYKAAQNNEILRDGFSDLRRNDTNQKSYFIGENFESLHNIHRPYLSPKLKAPRFRFVTESAEKLSPLKSRGFSAVQSAAYGGLGNAWGAGAFRYQDADLKGFGVTADELSPYYDLLTREIGISGDSDSLDSYFGSTAGLQPSIPLDRLGENLFRSFRRKVRKNEKSGFKLGRARLAVLSQDLGDRSAKGSENLAFWEPRLRNVYTPTMTLDDLIRAKKIEYIGRQQVVSFQELGDLVKLRVKHVDTHEERIFECKNFVLAAGALNSARIVLNSFQDFKSTLPLLDNQSSMTPFIHLRSIGKSVDPKGRGFAQLVFVYEGPLSPRSLQGSFYSYNALLASEVAMDFPLAFRGSLAACRSILPAFSLVTLFYPDEIKPGNFLSLNDAGELCLNYSQKVKTGAVEVELIRMMRRLGFYSHQSLVRVPEPGNGIHYAGTLPMGRRDLKYHTDISGRLNVANNVYVADSSVFPELPAKNHTLTIMANAMRVVDRVADQCSGGSSPGKTAI